MTNRKSCALRIAGAALVLVGTGVFALFGTPGMSDASLPYTAFAEAGLGFANSGMIFGALLAGIGVLVISLPRR